MLRFYLFVFSLLFLFSIEAYGDDSTNFSGAWVANGSRSLYAGKGDLKLYNYKFTGHVNLLENGIAGENDFWATCTGVGTSRKDVVARCLWKDLKGNSLLLNLQSISFQTETEVSGVILRGTGPYEGITGVVQFAWSSMFHGYENGVWQLNGGTENIQGSYVLPEGS